MQYTIGNGKRCDAVSAFLKPIKNNKGELVCKSPFPSMPLRFWNDKKNKKYLI